jgi:2,4-dienoyl-CoA reductase-like NADH-dependent reductase (Old Yellow Enzyme family)
MNNLFDPVRVGDIELPSRIFMAPLTRCRTSAGRERRGQVLHSFIYEDGKKTLAG